MKETEPTRSNPAVFPKNRNICYVVVAIYIMEFASHSDFHHGNRYHYVAKTTRDVELENDIIWKLVVSRPQLSFSDTLDESFQRTSRITAESAGALRDGANVVRTETGNDF